MEKWKKRAVDMLTTLALGRDDPTVIPYHPQKRIISAPEDRFFDRGTPEKHGISSKRLYNMLCELEMERHANIHNLMVLCGDEVICECSADGYDCRSWHISHSMAKTVCGMVIGTLVDEGRLHVDEKLVDLLPEVAYKDKRFPLITVEHLLTMQSGVDFAEAGVVTDSNWTETFFASSVKFLPGSKFAYNSMNTYILARIAERVSGESFLSLANRRIFSPMGINNYLWETSPEGTAKAGWGLYMSAESWAKLGVMMLRGGEFFGKRILSADWVRLSSSVKAIAPEFNGNFNYAYQMWTARMADETLFNGMLGQNVWICPRNDIVVVMQGGNNELFQASPALEIIRKYLGGHINDKLNRKDARVLTEKEVTFFENRRRVRPKERSRGLLCWLGIKPRTAFDEAWTPLLGSYALRTNNVGMLPLIVRAMQNNLNSSLERIDFEREGDELYLCFTESGENFRFPVGLYGYESSIMTVRGERYIVRAMGEVTRDISGETEYRIELLFPETASVRTLCVKHLGDNKISVTLAEMPNNRVVENMLARYSEMSSTIAFGVDIIERRLGEGIVATTITNTFNPTIVAVNTASDGCVFALEEENKRAYAEYNKARLIRTVVDKFFKEDDKSTKKPSESIEQKVKKSVTQVIDKISEKMGLKSKNDNKD